MNPYLIPAMDTYSINIQLNDIDTPDKIISLIAKYFCDNKILHISYPDITESELIGIVKGRTRKREIVEIRFAASYFIMQMLNLSLKNIGKFLGGRDHSSIINANRAYESDAETNSLYYKRHERLCEVLLTSNRIQRISRR